MGFASGNARSDGSDLDLLTTDSVLLVHTMVCEIFLAQRLAVSTASMILSSNGFSVP